MDIKIVINAWQHENDRIVFSGDPEQTIRQMRRKQSRFYRMLIFSDFLEAGVGVVMAALYIFFFAPMFGKTAILIYIGAAALLWLSAFFVIDRVRQERRTPNRSLADEIRHYLLRVDRRISLLRNVFWWYLLPCLIAWATLVGTIFIETLDAWRNNPIKTATNFAITILLAAVVFVGVYYLNQKTVEKELLPRKQELEQLLKDLASENTD